MSFKPTPTITLRLLALTISLMAGPLAAGANEEPQPPTNEEVAVEATEPLPEDIDWNALTAPIDRPYAAPAKLRTVPLPGNDSAPAAWSRNDRPNGTAAISVGQPVNSFWDMKAGVDLDVGDRAFATAHAANGAREACQRHAGRNLTGGSLDGSESAGRAVPCGPCRARGAGEPRA